MKEIGPRDGVHPFHPFPSLDPIMYTIVRTPLICRIKLLFKVKITFLGIVKSYLRRSQSILDRLDSRRPENQNSCTGVFISLLCQCRSRLHLQSFITKYYLHQVSLNVPSTKLQMQRRGSLMDVFEMPLSKRSVCCQVSFISPAIVHHSNLLLLCKQLSF